MSESTKISIDSFSDGVRCAPPSIDVGRACLAARVAPSESGRDFLDDLLWELRREMGAGVAAEDDLSAVLLDYRG